MWTNRTLIAFLLLTLAAAVPRAAENTDPDGDGSQYAYGENVGWFNAEPLGHGGPGMLVDDFELTGWIWGENVGWVSLSCKNMLTCGIKPYGVRNDGQGILGGFAWGENVGWINFAPHSAGVSIDPASGVFDGRAWGENVGWITFASTGANPYRVKTGWRCVPPPSPPTGSPFLRLSDAGWGWTTLEWSNVVGEAGYDVVFGELTALRTHSAPFVASTLGCLAENLTANSMEFTAGPPANEGWWFLVRGANCGGSGTQDTGEASQVAPRDPGIAGSGNDCL